MLLHLAGGSAVLKAVIVVKKTVSGLVQILEVWKVMKFKAEIFQALKSLKNDMVMSGKILENYEADLENIAFDYTG